MLGLGALLLPSCSGDGHERRIDVLRIDDGSETVTVERFDTPGELLALAPLGVVDMDQDGAEEVLLAADGGLLRLRGDGEVDELWSGSGVTAAEWVTPTSQHEGRILGLVATGDGPPELLSLACSTAQEVSCIEDGAIPIDDGVRALVAADFDGDEVMDVLTAGWDHLIHFPGTLSAEGNLVWLPSDRFTTIRTSSAQGFFDAIVTSDLDLDGYVDVVLPSWELGWAVLFCPGSRHWDEVIDSSELDDSCYAAGVGVGPIDDDELPDIVLACDEPQVLLNLGERQFEVVGPPEAENFFEDGDVVGSFGGGGASVLQWSTYRDEARLLRLEDGAWVVRPLTIPLYDVVWANGIAADLDGDGVDEAVFVDKIEIEDR